MKVNDEIIICKIDGQRIDAYLSDNRPDMSRAYIQKLIKDEMILVNGNPVSKNHKVRSGDEIKVGITEIKSCDAQAQEIPLDIVYEDDHLIVVNKNKGMVVHPAPGSRDMTLVNALLHHCKGSLSDINGVERPGIVHRIDKDTSGIIVAAKTNHTHRKLVEMLSAHDIKREYIAIVKGIINENKGKIDAPIGRHQKDRKKMAVNLERGKRAVTHFEVIERFKDATFIKVNLETGRTHQIRVHMAYINHYVLGDTVYGPKNQGYSIEGQALHAKVLGFVHPATGKYIEFSSDIPLYFQQLIKELTV